jgi:hypothetical protein
MKTNIRPLLITALATLLGTMAAPVVAQTDNVKADEGSMTAALIHKTRDMRFCEILVVRESGIEIYNTTGINDCPAELWDALDTKALAKKLGAGEVQLNGPHFWMMDTQTVSFGKTVSFGGLEARFVAVLDPSVVAKGGKKGSAPYIVFNPKKTQKMIYAKGKPVFELVDPDGRAYVLQAHEAKFPIETLGSLGKQMKQLPQGWQYRTRTLTEDLVLDLTPDMTIYAVGDEFHQYYTHPPETK